jgi:hypothetical protein
MESLRAQSDDLAGYAGWLLGVKNVFPNTSNVFLPLRRQLDTLAKSIDQHVAGLSAKAQQNQATGGKQILKRQLQSLKATLLSLGQKEAFTEGTSFSLQHGLICQFVSDPKQLAFC